LTTRRLNPSFDSKKFLEENWQKKPVLLPSLIENFSDSLSPEELAGLACDELVESRLVTEFTPGKWQLRHGPFQENDFTALPDSNWTLLVQAVDQWVDDVADIRSLFDFLPSWRVDDVMISFACQGGSVGPHYDYYDVFLLQGMGERNWKVGDRCSPKDLLIADSELSLLENFETTMEFSLVAGDALYIPPRFAHWGTATNDSLCYSIGFRAPSMAEMIEGFSDFLIKEQDPALRFEDLIGDSLKQANKLEAFRGAEIRSEMLEPSFQQLKRQLAQKEKFTAWFGCYVSQPKYPELIEPLEQELSPAELAQLLADGLQLEKNPSSRFAFMESADGDSVLLFVDGAMARFSAKQLPFIASLCEAAKIIPEPTSEVLAEAELSELLRRLLNQGSLLAFG
jgi:50S ribosomal protein L16 3-hydroxylase